MHQKRAQAAMEFLLTYGWAILVVLAVIGALGYFGVLNPSALLPEKCVFGPGMICSDFRATLSGHYSQTEGALTFDLVNGLGENVYITGFSINDPALKCAYVQLDNCDTSSSLLKNAFSADVNCISIKEFNEKDTVGNIPAITDEGMLWKAGERLRLADWYMELPCLKSTMPEAGSKLSTSVEVTYRKAGSTLDHTLEGDISFRVTE